MIIAKHRPEATFVLGDACAADPDNDTPKPTTPSQRRNGGLVDICDNYLHVQRRIFGNRMRRGRIFLRHSEDEGRSVKPRQRSAGNSLFNLNISTPYKFGMNP